MTELTDPVDKLDALNEARRLLREAATAEEINLLARLTDANAINAYKRVKASAVADAFVRSSLGDAFVQQAAQIIADACEVWLTSDDQAAVLTSLNNARAARSAVGMFERIIADGKVAEEELARIERDFGETA